MKMIFKGMPVFFLAFLFISACAAFSDAHFKVTVTNAQGIPIQGAHVQGYFTNWRYDYKPQPERLGVTDENGKTEISGPGIASIDVRVYKKGYYESKKKIPIEREKDKSISFVLRPKKNPIAMYAKHLLVQVDKSITSYGLDLLRGSVVLKHGEGVKFDVYISSQLVVKSKNFADPEFSRVLKFTFPNKNDGIAVAELNDKWWDSAYKSAYRAPEYGYAPVFEIRHALRRGKGYQDKNVDKPIYMRIRTITDKKGNIVSAIYCKIFPGVRPMGDLSNTPGFVMTYYCDPTPNDRNVEFDPDKNLFRNLKPENRVLAP